MDLRPITRDEFQKITLKHFLFYFIFLTIFLFLLGSSQFTSVPGLLIKWSLIFLALITMQRRNMILFIRLSSFLQRDDSPAKKSIFPLMIGFASLIPFFEFLTLGIILFFNKLPQKAHRVDLNQRRRKSLFFWIFSLLAVVFIAPALIILPYFLIPRAQVNDSWAPLFMPAITHRVSLGINEFDRISEIRRTMKTTLKKDLDNKESIDELRHALLAEKINDSIILVLRLIVVVDSQTGTLSESIQPERSLAKIEKITETLMQTNEMLNLYSTTSWIYLSTPMGFLQTSLISIFEDYVNLMTTVRICETLFTKLDTLKLKNPEQLESIQKAESALNSTKICQNYSEIKLNYPFLISWLK